MQEFSVWAPYAQRVELGIRFGDIVDRYPMEGDDDGWFGVEVEAPVGTRYGFSIDGGPLFPDPRSLSQPDGVHELSAVIDESFAWTDQQWRGRTLPSSVLYEVHIGTFTGEGTFSAAIDKLDHLVELGITAVEVLPIAAFPGERGWGYDGVALFAAYEPYGGALGCKQFVDACHAKGLSVILDVVYNHLGPDGNYLGAYGPYFTDTYTTPWGSAVNYDDRGSDEVRRFVIDNAIMWLQEFHVDGLRLDAVHAIYDKSSTHILEALSVEVEQLSAAQGRPLVLIAESDLNDPRMVEPVTRGGRGMQGQWNDDFHHALHQSLTGEATGYYGDFDGFADVAYALVHNFVFVGQFQPSRGKSHGRDADSLAGWHFIGYLQNHDQIGNRAIGERLSATVSEGRLHIGAAITLLAPFVPMLFQGEEWAASTPFQYFTDHVDAALADAVREGRKNEFGHDGWKPEDVPDPQAPTTFTASKLRWDERTEGLHGRLLAWHRALIALRLSESDLLDGGADLEAWEDRGILSLRRGSIRLLANLSDEPIEASDISGELVLGSTSEVQFQQGGLVVPPDGVAIVREG